MPPTPDTHVATNAHGSTADLDAAARPPGTGLYRELRDRVESAGLLERRRGHYLMIAVALVAAGAGLTVLGWQWRHSWLLLLPAAASGVLLAQWGFLAHDAAHRGIFTGTAANDRVGRLVAGLVLGTSYSGWRGNHNRHHARPNQPGADPSIARGVFAFTAADVATAGPLRARWWRRQGWWLFPMLLLAGVDLYRKGLPAVLQVFRPAARPARGRREAVVEAVTITLHHLVLLGVALVLWPAGRGLAALAVQTGVFGLVIGGAFVPNHVGRPQLDGHERDFLRRQVLTARNLPSDWWTGWWTGGLNAQIEHHLFPSLARPQLPRARRIVRAFCAEHGVPYTEQRLGRALAEVVATMNRIGAGPALATARCPVSRQLGR